jgi:hypothetical protein
MGPEFLLVDISTSDTRCDSTGFSERDKIKEKRRGLFAEETMPFLFQPRPGKQSFQTGG